MAKISLCLIAGNVAELIERCLKSFGPIADEICIVRAVGCQEPDSTIEIAIGWCNRNNKTCKALPYYNAPANSNWPHVDDFAAARQQSFKIASGDFSFWCDTDDVFEGDPQLIRDFARAGNYPALIIPYKIFAKGLVVNRVRMMARGSGRWIHPVHEDYKFNIEPVNAVQDDRCAVIHLPRMDGSKDSTPRNLRILESMDREQMPTGMLYHLHTELILAKRIDESIEVAKLALARQNLGQPEKYEIFLNFAEASQKDGQKAAFLHQAYATDPTRREALGLLSVIALRNGAIDRSLAYARQMLATEAPAECAWNERTGIYGWIGQDIYCQALRANGHLAEAEKIRKAAFDAVGGTLIALVHATRGRPEKAAATRKKWLELASNPERIEHIFVFDSDDEQSKRLKAMHHLCIPAGGGCVSAWNHGAFATSAPIIIQLSDDWIPPQQWDKLILSRIGDVDAPSVLAISDGIRADRLLCMAICTRAYVQVDHFLFHPFFKGMYSDNWFTKQAYDRGLVIEARDLIFQHDHPIAIAARAGKTDVELDDTYHRQNSPQSYHDGKAVFEYLDSGNDWSSVPGYFNFWQFYTLIANRLQDGDTVCEVGVWLGRSIIFLAQLCQRLGKKVRFIAVDTFNGEPDQPEHAEVVKQHGGSIKAAFCANLLRCGVSESFQILDVTSLAASNDVESESLAFCFIDASHDYNSVKSDILVWLPKVRKDGILAGHDVQWAPVQKAVQDYLPDAKIVPPVWMKQI
jgi:tetratricopeptide (TPR) repeat protein/predicted O-methyltransferase YrrM